MKLGIAKALVIIAALGGSLMAVPALAFDARNTISNEGTIPETNQWRGLGRQADTQTIYTAKAVDLFSSAVRSLSNLFGDEQGWRSTLQSSLPKGLLTDLNGAIGSQSNASYMALDYKAPAKDLGVLGDLATTIWLEREDRSLDRDANGDLDVDQPWQMGVKVNLPF